MLTLNVDTTVTLVKAETEVESDSSDEDVFSYQGSRTEDVACAHI